MGAPPPLLSDFPAAAHHPKFNCSPTLMYLRRLLNTIMGDMSEYHTRSHDFLLKSIDHYTTFLLAMISLPGCARVSCSRKELMKYWNTICTLLNHLNGEKFAADEYLWHFRRKLVFAAKIIWRELESRGFELPKDPLVFSSLLDSPMTAERPFSTLRCRILKLQATAMQCMNVGFGNCWCTSKKSFRHCASCRIAKYCSS
ncbi:hypothetical protein BDV98DRAFT_200424 [Pterulicium gracile]|uniref:Uncharacterized protein n=1 Tax=Pterulicium gracile TaxID=1884261 RepID=A0A5C3Q9D7_9AGAR|nr:hypothetical protein BDV98DRAFT_200424 [Pterula gracilis]